MDHSAFAGLAERHRRELHVHCHRMLASFDEAEDAVIAEITTFPADHFAAFGLPLTL
jgi:hypothetical protein